MVPSPGALKGPTMLAAAYAPAGSLQYLNVSAFQPVAAMPIGSFGNLGPGIAISPGFSEIDLAISRSFYVREGMRLDIRGEAFNVPNSFRAGCPTGSSTCTGTGFIGQNLSTPATFGKVTNSMDPRIIQLSAKFVF